MSQRLLVPSWVESDGVEVWLVAGAGRGLVADLSEREQFASTRAGAAAVVAANADADDAERIEQLISRGYGRVFSMVELERATDAVAGVSTDVSIVAVGQDDADAMHWLTAAVWAGRPFFTMPTVESYRDWVCDADPRLMWLAWQDTTLVGYVAAREDPSGIEVVDLQVHPAHQRHGVATALLAGIIAEANRRRSARVWLETEGDDPVGAREFYEHHGFRLTVEHLRFRKPARPIGRAADQPGGAGDMT